MPPETVTLWGAGVIVALGIMLGLGVGVGRYLAWRGRRNRWVIR